MGKCDCFLLSSSYKNVKMCMSLFPFSHGDVENLYNTIVKMGSGYTNYENVKNVAEKKSPRLGEEVEWEEQQTIGNGFFSQNCGKRNEENYSQLDVTFKETPHD
ncbi:hypothetical protein POVCU1_018000 [Plasmodium ovale curtisi]|uniref:Uncharacterized protein n=1 Tax=Plasmodium ovale curtisi TaxID=864141 RepID=A0A1A8WBN0_PLAOA|nr:hypothetical protein POVCU1_018000 [Plasmodium ovale curtisi]